MKKLILGLMMLGMIFCFFSGAAEEVDAEALYRQGMDILSSDSLTDEKVQEGLELLQQAGEQGNANAWYVLGCIYEEGLMGTQDYELAVQYYTECLKLTMAPAVAYKLGLFAENGAGMDQDLEYATLLYAYAADCGNLDATKALARIYLDDPSAEKNAEGMELLETAGNEGDEESILALAFRYEFGMGTAVDYVKASEWLHKVNQATEEDMYYGEGKTEIVQILMNLLSSHAAQDEAFCNRFYQGVWDRLHQTFSEEIAYVRHITIAQVGSYPQYDENLIGEAVQQCYEWICARDPEKKEKVEWGDNEYLQVANGYQRSYVSEIFFKKGFQLFEEGKYLEAIAEYRHCITLDPTDVDARFEITEAYIQTGLLSEARQELKELVPYITTDFDRAHYYRRIGFMAIDDREYDVGGACMLISLQYYESQHAENELKYIEQMTGTYPAYTDEEIRQILTEHEIHLW